MQETFNIHHLSFEANWSRPEIGQQLIAALRFLRFEPREQEEADFRIEVTLSEDVSTPNPAGLLAEAQRGIHLFRVDDKTWIVGHSGFATVSISTGSIDIRITPTAVGDLGFLLDLLQYGVLVAGRSNGQHALHGGGVVSPSGTGVLIVGGSGSGKSTITTGLAMAGWSYLSDDIQYLVEADGTIRALPVGRFFRLSPRLIRQLSMEQFVVGPVGSDGKQLLDADRAFQKRFRDFCIPQVVVFSEIVNTEQSRLSEITSSEALTRLLAEFTVLGLDSSQAQADLHFARDLVAQLTAFRFESGRDVGESPNIAADYFAEVESGPSDGA